MVPSVAPQSPSVSSLTLQGPIAQFLQHTPETLEPMGHGFKDLERVNTVLCSSSIFSSKLQTASSLLKSAIFSISLFIKIHLSCNFYYNNSLIISFINLTAFGCLIVIIFEPESNMHIAEIVSQLIPLSSMLPHSG